MPRPDVHQQRELQPMRTGTDAGWFATKVPEATALFWLTKLLTTGMGESASDFLVHHFAPAAAVAAGFVAFCVALAMQLRSRRYVPAIYWFTVAMVGVFGTMAADVLHVGLHVPYVASAVFFSLALVAVFATWQATENTLSIHSIDTPRRELFYWATVVTTFALGTAAGDVAAITVHLGYLSAGLAFGAAIAAPAIAYRWLHLNAIAAFWIAYVLTRPLGASFADWMGVSKDRGGLGWGPGPVSLTLAVIICALVIALSTRRGTIAPTDQQPGVVSGTGIS